MRWHKLLPYEESVRIPFFVAGFSGQGGLRAGLRDAVVNHVDIGPTTLGLCGIDRSPEMVGFDYSGECLKRESGSPAKALPESAFLQQYHGVPRPWSRTEPWRAVVTRDGWKLACGPGHEWLFHNLGEDPYELANFANDNYYRDERARCRNLLADWIDRTGDAFPLPG